MKASIRLQDTAIRYFLEVAQLGSISEASVRLNVATSAISRQISSLEDTLGAHLFERQPRGMKLSAAGEMLAAYARKNALESARVVAEIGALNGLEKGHVNIACSEGFAMDFIPRTISNFRQQHNGIHFHLKVCAPGDVAKLVSHGESDIGITLSLSPTKDITVEYRQPSPIMAVFHPTHPLAHKKSVSLAQLQPYPIALPEENTTVRQLFDICCSRLNLLFEPILESNHMATLSRFTSFGGGIHLSGEISMRHQIATQELIAVPIRDRGMDVRNTEIQTLSGRTLPAVVKVFLDYLIDKMKHEEMMGF
ncbi:LysR family transcriptional regulator [Marinomonas mediterranea]|uniref:LysR family transcriptional regulator n=1 Tax=Marinomonas mediterranea TaxID=119864 RepID=UPI0023492D15|nr:LysR family transcriptional regulator [Marinomonas mediterranea]WCN08143.1 LysR family transcriptional regulator [Marinomonas mediterranea]WCN12212.1 LysR family transcriptional regulator [Marinomonas mediterranea]